MRVLFVIDPLAGLRPDHDTSVSLMEAAQRRGMDVWVAGAADLAIDSNGAAAWARPVRIIPAERREGRWPRFFRGFSRLSGGLVDARSSLG
jgi:glutathione synthase